MEPDITFCASPKEKADTAIAGVYKGGRLSAAAEKLDKSLNGFIAYHLGKRKNFNGKKGQVLVLSAPKDNNYTTIVLAGLGDASSLDAGACEAVGGKLFLTLKAAGSERAEFHIARDQAREKVSAADMAAHIAMGVKLRSYSFDKYKSKKEGEDDEATAALSRFAVITDEAEAAGAKYKDFAHVAAGVFFARDLVNEPPNELYPESFAGRIKDELRPLGVDVEVIDEKKMQKLGFHAAYTVGMGSERRPCVAVMRWKGDGKSKNGPLAFVGKGVTFDTGGINIKPTAGLADMKLDMGGAATVVGLMKTLAGRKSGADVIGIVGLAENMPSHNAYRPSDIINSYSGQKIEVMNTDAEGRLVLADCMSYVQDIYKPSMMIDLATLTGAMMVALGHEYCGTFANNDDLWKQMEAASKSSGEKLWRMPLDEAYRKEMDSKIADIKTLGNSKYAGACTAAAFLERFVEGDLPWAHMDIAGTAWVNKDTPVSPKPGTGFGVRVLDRLIAENYE